MKYFFLSVFTFIFFPFTTFASFSDVSESYKFYKSISFIESEGIVNGYSDGTFKPENTINRAEFIKIIIQSKYPDYEIRECNFAEYNFPDIQKSDWFSQYACLAKKEGIIRGYADGMFNPENNISLPEAMKILIKTSSISDSDIDNLYDSTFNQEKSTDIFSSHWGTRYIYYFLKNIDEKELDVEKRFFGFTQKVTDDFFSHFITRGEMTYLVNFFISSNSLESYGTGIITSLNIEEFCLSDTGCIHRDNDDSENSLPFFEEYLVITLKDVNLFSFPSPGYELRDGRKLIAPTLYEGLFTVGDFVRVKTFVQEMTGTTQVKYIEKLDTKYTLDSVKINIVDALNLEQKEDILNDYTELYTTADVLLEKEVKVKDDTYIYTLKLSKGHSCRGPLGFACINYLLNDDGFLALKISGFPIYVDNNWVYFANGGAGGGGSYSSITAFNIDTKESYTQTYDYSVVENPEIIFLSYTQDFVFEENIESKPVEETEELKKIFSPKALRYTLFRSYLYELIEKGEAVIKNKE